MGQKNISRLKNLEQRLKPVNLLEQARAYATLNDYSIFDLADDFDEGENFLDRNRKVQNTIQQIGVAVAQDKVVFDQLLPEMVSNNNSRLRIFGEGLADGSDDRRSMWQNLYQQFEKAPPEKRQITVMLGFLSSCARHEPTLYHKILDSLIDDKLLGQWFPYFQMTSGIDRRGIERLHQSIDEGNVDIYSFKNLAWGHRYKAISDDDLAKLLHKILSKAGGMEVVLKILSMRLDDEKKDQPYVFKV
jgi:hypothetical protein